MLLLQVTLKNRSNAIAWNPMEAYMFTVANEDYKFASALLTYYLCDKFMLVRKYSFV